MWCKTCNIETNEKLCPVCGSVTIEDVPTEVYWCACCEAPVIQAATQADKGFCPVCKGKTKYLSADLRPVFPEERLLLELLLGKKPFVYAEKSVWASNSRYYINGKSVSIPSKIFQEADAAALSKMLAQNKSRNTYEYFDKQIARLIGTHSDVFQLCAVFVFVLTKRFPGGIIQDSNNLNTTPEIRNVLIRSLSNDYSQRPADGSELVIQYNDATYAKA